MQAQKKQAPFLFAVVTMLLAIMLYDVMGAIIKHLGEAYPAEQLSLFRNLFALIPTLLILLWNTSWVQSGRPLVIRQWKLAILRGGIGTLAQLCFYLAVLHLEFATATTILFAGPLFVTALSIPFLGHRVGPARWLAVLIGFTGVLLVVQPTAPDFTWYAILPLCAAVGYASISTSAQLFDKSVPTALINLYYNAGALVGAFALVILSGNFVPIGSLEDWLWLGVMGTAGGSAAFCMIAAYRSAQPSSLSPFEYFAIPFSFCLGWLFFAETPFDRLFPGVLLIVGGGLFIIWRERSSKV